MIIHANILEWATTYDGEPFHALLCDPPYHLTETVKRFGKPGSAEPKGDLYARAARGFMGRNWDGGDIAFQPETWAALGALLYPGAFLFAFAGTRGYHRMACAIEDAGFIIHPAIGWCFGCLSDDTEVLTKDGWEPYHKAIEGTDIMCYNTEQDALEWHAVQELYTYDYNDTAYHIHSDRTDQIVSRNHRCLVKRNGTYVFQLAETLASQETIPILETLPDMRSIVQRRKQRPVSQTQDLFPSMRQSNACSRAKRSDTQAQGTNRGLPTMRQGNLSNRCTFAQSEGLVLFAVVPSQVRDWATYQATRRQRQGQETTWQGISGRAQSGMEGRRNLLQKTRQLQGREVYSLPSRVYQHGPQGWLCDGASDHGRAGNRPAAAALGSGTPQRPRSGTQHAGQFSAVRQQSRSQALRTPRIAIPDLATVTPVHYRGVVWCVRVPTGAFVARRNGKIFITGNSGFPKATRIDTQVDRRAGVERTKVGTKKHQPKFAAKDFGYREKDNGYNSRERETFDVTAPATELAQAWQGHRYGGQVLKPAFEFICVAQKPYQGKPVECITRTGAGALNIDQARIDGAARPLRWQRPRGMGFSGGTDNGPCEAIESEHGRWPANLMLDEHTAALIDAQSGYSKRALRGGVNIGSFAGITLGTWETRDSSELRGHDDSGGASRFFYQADWMAERLEDSDPVLYEAKSSRSEREAGLDPRQVKLINSEAFTESTINDGRQKSIDNPYQRGETTRRNTHPTIKPIALARHLATLLLPPAEYAPRRLLVPFSGAGSEMIGALLAGWDEITGVELEADHVRIAEARLAYWQQRRHEFLDPSKPITAALTDAPAGQLDLFGDNEL